MYRMEENKNRKKKINQNIKINLNNPYSLEKFLSNNKEFLKKYYQKEVNMKSLLKNISKEIQILIDSNQEKLNESILLKNKIQTKKYLKILKNLKNAKKVVLNHPEKK